MRSRNYYDILRWVEKAIDSCYTAEQFDSAEKLIVNFSTQTFVPYQKRKPRDDSSMDVMYLKLKLEEERSISKCL
jgi:hypothetical protein